jgi:hypothetical protein
MTTRRQFLESLAGLAALVAMPKAALDAATADLSEPHWSAPGSPIRIWLDDLEVTSAVLSCEVSYSVAMEECGERHCGWVVTVPGPQEARFSLRLAHEDGSWLERFSTERERLAKPVTITIQREDETWSATVFLTSLAFNARSGSIAEWHVEGVASGPVEVR